MNLVSMPVITDDVKRLVGFNEGVTGLSAKWATEDFAELATPACTLAIASKRTMDRFGAGAAHPADIGRPRVLLCGYLRKPPEAVGTSVERHTRTSRFN